jgi:hypothetical protein
MSREHTGDFCAISIIYCPSAPPPLVRDFGTDYEVMLEPAKAARDAAKDALVPEYESWDKHRDTVKQVLGEHVNEIEGVGFAHQTMKGAHQMQVFAAPVMDDLRPFMKVETFYDNLGGACFTVDVDPEKKRKPLICRLCLRPVRTLTLKHKARYEACGLNQPEPLPVPMPAPAIPGAESLPGMPASGGAAVPSMPFVNTLPPSVTPAQAPAQTPMPTPQVPIMPQNMATSGNPAFPTPAGGGIPVRIGLGDGMAQAGAIPPMVVGK